MQAIVTTYLPPSEYRGSRIKVKCVAKTKTYNVGTLDNILYERGIHTSMGGDERHQLAAELLVNHLGWADAGYGRLVMGHLPDGDRVFVFVQDLKLPEG